MAEESTLPKAVTTSRTDGIRHDVEASTPVSMPNVDIIAMPMAKRIWVRAYRTFIQTFLSSLGISGTAVATVPAIGELVDSLGLSKLVTPFAVALILSFGAALVAAAQLFMELSAEWDTSHPERLA